MKKINELRSSFGNKKKAKIKKEITIFSEEYVYWLEYLVLKSIDDKNLFFSNVEEAIKIIERLEINEISKNGGISALKLIINSKF